MKRQVQRSQLLCVCVAFVIVFASSIVLGQASNGTIGGLVTDEAGALVPDASIVLVEVDTGLRRSASADRQGAFLISLLRPSSYRVTVQRAGFATSEVRELKLPAGGRVHIAVTLRVGEPAEFVEVSPDSLFVRSDSADLTTTISRRVIEDAPLNGRSFQSLIALVPGVIMTRSDSTNQGQFSVNGQRTDSNYFRVDGVGANFGAEGGYALGGTVPATNSVGSAASLVSIDALQEVSVGRSTYSPEFGRSSGGQISVTTRSGTNGFHGSVFEYFRNDALDANDWFRNRLGAKRAPLKHNDFGGVLGGPLVKDRTFFFISYEGLRLRQPRPSGLTVPSQEVRDSAPAAIRPLLDAYPLPTGANISSTRAPYAASESDPREMDATSVRLDHRLSKTLTIFGRFNYAPSDRSRTTLSTVRRTSTTTETLTIGSTQVIGNSSSNELRANMSRSHSFTTTEIEEIGGAVRPSDSVLFQQPFATPGRSSFSFTVDSATLAVGVSGQRQRQFNLVDNFSITRKTHQLRFGFDYRLLLPIATVADYGQTIQTTAARVATGTATSVTVAGRLGDMFPQYTNFSVFGQDAWQATRRLTLTYGLRWDLNPPPKEKNGNYPITTVGGFDPDLMSLAPGMYPFWKTRYTNVAPRLGSSYLLSRRAGAETVIRGGFGVFYDLAMGTASAVMRPGLFPYTGSVRYTNVSIPLSESLAAPPGFSLDPPYQEIFVFNRNLKTPRTYEGSLGVEQSLGSSQSLSVSYVHASGRSLITDQFLWSPNDNFFRLHIVDSTGTSDHDSLQVQFQRRSTRGPELLVSYTLGRSLDTSSNDSSYLNTVDANELRLDRAPSDFDVRHSLSTSVSYRPPALRVGKLFSPIVNGWSLSGILIARSAMPITYIEAGNTICDDFECFVDCDAFGNSLCPRPDIVTGEPIFLRGQEYPGGKRLNPAAFRTPPPGRQGDLQRNALRGFPAIQLDISLKRNFRIREKLSLQLNAEVFNVMNHPNFADPEAFLAGDPEEDTYYFGIASRMLGRSMGGTGSAGEAGLNPIYQLGTPRSVQLSARLKF